MRMPTVDEQLSSIDELIKTRQDLRSPLEFHKTILQAQRDLRESSRRGTTLDWDDDRSTIASLQQKAETSKRPIANFLDPSIFEPDWLIHACEAAERLAKNNTESVWFVKILSELIAGKANLLDSLRAALKGDSDFFDKLGARIGVSPALVLFTVSALIQPCLEAIAAKVDPSFLDRWWQAPCPICGRRPIVAKLKSRRRYLTCSLCDSEYLADQFLCTNCGTTDPASLKFLAPEGRPEFRIDFCEKCKHYVKVVDQDRLKEAIPKGLEDTMTTNLDLMAKDHGLIRV